MNEKNAIPISSIPFANLYRSYVKKISVLVHHKWTLMFTVIPYTGIGEELPDLNTKARYFVEGLGKKFSSLIGLFFFHLV